MLYLPTLLLIISHMNLVNGGFTLEQGIPHFNTKPYFLDPPAKNVSALEGQSAYLHCRVAQLGDKKVSWIRSRDLHVLTSSVHTFASDQRFLALHSERSENWTLHIRFSQTRDSGEYQCQVNTEPRISMSYHLTIEEASTILEGPDQRIIRAGDAIKLVCTTGSHSEHPGLLYWYHGIDMLLASGRVSINTSLDTIASSELIISDALKSDSGNYTCWPTNFKPISTMVHVIPDEQPAAMSHGTVNSKVVPVITTSGTSIQSTLNLVSILAITLTTLSLYSALPLIVSIEASKVT